MTNGVKQGQGFGYVNSKGTTCMTRCFECGAENWAMAVAAGHCAWCGYDPNQDQEEPDESKETTHA